MSTLTAHWEPEPSWQRMMLLRVSPEVLVHLLGMDGSKRFRILGLPLDAKIINVSDQIRFERGEIVFMVQSDEFPKTLAGNVIPELTLTVEHIDCPDTFDEAKAAATAQPTAIVEEATV